MLVFITVFSVFNIIEFTPDQSKVPSIADCMMIVMFKFVFVLFVVILTANNHRLWFSTHTIVALKYLIAC